MPVKLSDTKLLERGGMPQQQTFPIAQSKATREGTNKQRQAVRGSTIRKS